MLRLEGLGGANLHYDGGAAPPQRRRIALFALLAVAADRGMTREKIVGYLWPESTVDNARHSLEQLVYGIRRTYGDEILLGGNPLHLNFTSFSSDVGDFESALAKGELEHAVELYRGSFLDGLFIPDAPEFERWASSEAQRLGELATRAFEKLAEKATRDGRHDVAAAWLRKRVALDPLSARGATLLMQALAEGGDTASALQHAGVYERLIRQELDTDPDPSVVALANSLRAAPPVPLPPRRAPEVDAEKDSRAPVIPPSPRRSDAPIAVERAEAADARRWPQFIGAATVLLVASAFLYAHIRSSTSESGSTAAPRLAVIPFRATVQDSSLAYLGEGMVDLLSARFTGEGGPEAVDPRAVISAWRDAGNPDDGFTRAQLAAKRVNATEILEGELIQTGMRAVTVNGRLSDLKGRVLARESVHGSLDSVAKLSDELGNRLLAGRAGEDAQRVSLLVKEPNDAITAFLQGRAEYRRGNFTAARAFFSRALDVDSTFAAAALELGLATGGLFQWTTVTTDTSRATRGISMGGVGSGTYPQWLRAIQSAMRDSARLSPRDRIVLTALRGGYPRGIYAREVLANWEHAVQAVPDLPDAHFWLGHVLLFQGQAMGLADARHRARAEFGQALSLDRRYAPALRGMVEVAALDRDTVLLRTFNSRYLSMDSTTSEATYVKWRVAGIRHDSAVLRESEALFVNLEKSVLERIRLLSQLDGVAIEDAARANSVIQSRAGTAAERQVALHAARQIALNEGRPSQAVQIAAVKRALEPNADLQRGYAIRDALFWDGDTIAAKAAVLAFDSALSLAPSASNRNPRRSSYMQFSTALWRLGRGDTTGAGNAIAFLKRSGVGRDPQSLVLEALLANLARRSDATAVLARLDSLASLGFGATPHVINLVSAKIHEQRGEKAAALAAIRRGRWYFPPENLTTYLREEGTLAAATGDTTAAIKAFNQYLVLRRKPEPGLRAQADSVRTALARLVRH
jgi:DNA-binding SARP family transcriptional activator